MMAEKTCARCKETKAHEAFGKRTGSGRPVAWCRPCMRAYRRERQGRPYGLTDAAYAEMMKDATCSVCGADSSGKHALCVDHDHKTGAVRGVLCKRCNCSIGQALDDPERLRALADYLEIHRGRDPV